MTVRDSHRRTFLCGRTLGALAAPRAGEILEELVRLEVDVIVAPGDEIPVRAKEVTTTVPFVMMSLSDPVELDDE